MTDTTRQACPALGFDATPVFGNPNQEDATPVVFRAFPRGGPPRWLMEARFRSPWYLRTWPRANLRAKLIYAAASAGGRIGVHLPSRQVQTMVAPDATYARLQAQFDRLAVFLGTPGRNRKVVIYAARGDDGFFVKVPLERASEELVENEMRALKTLATDPAIAPLIPRASRLAGHLAIEDLTRRRAGYKALTPAAVAKVHDLLRARGTTLRRLDELRSEWAEQASAALAADAAADHPAPIRSLIAECRAATQAYFDALAPDLQVECYEAHGDFTRWNVLVSPAGEPQIIDWEMFGLKPLYFDLVHYFVADCLLVRRQTAPVILRRLEEVGLVAGPSWWNCVGLYFAFQSTYYCARYEHQANLHPQACWQMMVWRNVLEKLADCSAK